MAIRINLILKHLRNSKNLIMRNARKGKEDSDNLEPIGSNYSGNQQSG